MPCYQLPLTMKLTLRILVTYLVLTLLFMGASVTVFSIPGNAIEDHVRQSVQQVTEDGKMFTVHVGPVEPFKVGTFSDCLILGIAYCSDTDHPLQSAMSDKFFILDGSPEDAALLMIDQPDNPLLQPVIYSRYWHGNQVVIKPLLYFTTVHGIRVINCVLLAVLLLLLLAMMWRRVGHADSLIVTLSLAAVMTPSVPMSLNYVPTFYIALLSSLAILCWKPVTANRSCVVILFFVIGALTTYFDLLTTPMVALAVPLIVYMLYKKPKETWRTVIMLSLAWLAGYALLWATKWVLTALITGHAALEDAMGAVTQRTVGHGEQDYMMWCLKTTFMALVAVIFTITALIALFGKSWQTLRRYSWLLLVAMASFVWTFVLLEHTWHHPHFTWRTYVVLAIGVMLFMRYALDLKRPLALFKKTKTTSKEPSL